MSVQYTFFGKVHPERCNVSIGEIGAKVLTHRGEIDGELRYFISLSQVTATFVCDKPVPNVYTLKNYVDDVVRLALDALGYVLACGYDLEITQMIDSLGNQPVVFGVGIPRIEKAAAEAGVTFENVLQVFREPRGGYLQRCLADLREAIRAPKDTGFFCYRALESLRQFFVGEKGANGDKASWELLRSELAVDRGDLDAIKKFADPVRHGDATVMSDEERAEIFVRTWCIVSKFVKYANAGYTTAPIT